MRLWLLLIWSGLSNLVHQHRTQPYNKVLDQLKALVHQNACHSSIISLKSFIYKIRTLKKNNYATRREEDSCNSRQLVLWKFSEIKRIYPLQFQGPYWHHEFLLLHEIGNQVWTDWRLPTSWVRALSSSKNWTVIK